MKGEEDKDRKDLKERNVSNGKIILKGGEGWGRKN